MGLCLFCPQKTWTVRRLIFSRSWTLADVCSAVHLETRILQHSEVILHDILNYVLNEEHWNRVFKLKHTFRILKSRSTILLFWIEPRWMPSNILSGCVFNFLSILLVKYTFLWENFFTNTEVWRSILEVHFNISSRNEEIHLPNIQFYTFFELQMNYNSNTFFFSKKHIYKYRWSITYK